jgi:hypothetical protein
LALIAYPAGQSPLIGATHLAEGWATLAGPEAVGASAGGDDGGVAADVGHEGVSVEED